MSENIMHCLLVKILIMDDTLGHIKTLIKTLNIFQKPSKFSGNFQSQTQSRFQSMPVRR
jgi:hypothetical protein